MIPITSFRRSPLRCRRFWLWHAGLFGLALPCLTALVLIFGNPQWNRWIYMTQAYSIYKISPRLMIISRRWGQKAGWIEYVPPRHRNSLVSFFPVRTFRGQWSGWDLKGVPYKVGIYSKEFSIAIRNFAAGSHKPRDASGFSWEESAFVIFKKGSLEQILKNGRQWSGIFYDPTKQRVTFYENGLLMDEIQKLSKDNTP